MIESMHLLFGEFLSGLSDDPPDTSLLAQGLAMRDAVLRGLVACQARDATLQVSCIVQAHAPLPADLAQAQQLTPDAAMRGLASTFDAVWLIAPETDDTLALLCEAVPADRWLGCDAASIRTTASKSRALALLHAAGVPTPLAFIEDLDITAWVVKPDDGVGGTDARQHTTLQAAHADLAQRQAAGLHAVLEPWVDGTAMSLSLLCDAGRVRVLSVNHQSIAVAADGTLLEGDVTTQPLHGASAPPDLQRLADAVAAALPGLRGPVGIDYVQHPRRGPVLIEVNPRITSAWVDLLRHDPLGPVRAVLDLLVRPAMPAPPPPPAA